MTTLTKTDDAVTWGVLIHEDDGESTVFGPFSSYETASDFLERATGHGWDAETVEMQKPSSYGVIGDDE